eukprot:TRINITY_DN24182_c0_g1_i2.p1 TRINITY_DN24182_c0_g1~~TRINITY_DN24182_c0_g1_i2.p1  ORF type:complete len:309 (+),score=28.51 TRINITY_DN24182_c0_g1_i2:480-1406(+)
MASNNHAALQLLHGQTIPDTGQYLAQSVKWATAKTRPHSYCYEETSRTYLQASWNAGEPSTRLWKGNWSSFKDCLRAKMLIAGDSLSLQFARSLMLISMSHSPECSGNEWHYGEMWTYSCGDLHLEFWRVNAFVELDAKNVTRLSIDLQRAIGAYVRSSEGRKYLVLGHGQWFMPWTQYWFKIPFIVHVADAGFNWLRSYKFAVRFVLQELKRRIATEDQRGNTSFKGVFWMTTPPRHGIGPFNPRRLFNDACDFEGLVPTTSFTNMNAINTSIAQNVLIRSMVLAETDFNVLETEVFLGLRADAHVR